MSEPLFALPGTAQSPVSVEHNADKTNLTPILEKSIVSVDRDLQEPYIAKDEASGSIEGTSGSPQIMIGSDRTSSVDGRLCDVLDNHQPGKYKDDDEGGVVILDESPASRIDSDEEESAHSEGDIAQASMYAKDSIVFAAAARVNANLLLPNDDCDASLVDFEQLLAEAYCGERNRTPPRDDCDDESECDNRIDTARDSDESSWYLRNPFSSLSWSRSKRPDRNRAPPAQHTLHTPVRATKQRDDKYIVEIDIYPHPSETNRRLDIRDVMDTMANVELLHLWFDPVPAVFDAALKDGSCESMLSPRTEASNSLEDCRTDRQQDGQWVEISTPLLSIPSDSRVSRCLRTLRVALRSMIGFPARMRSMIFVERSSGRMGMTLGPYPDGFLCGKGTMAYHAFEIRASDEEDGKRGVVISDEVRLKRGGDDFDEARRNGFFWTIFLLLVGALKWVLCFRLYKPDLASYMEQSVSSMERLRNLVERGESAAYAGGQLITDGSDEGESTTNMLGIPLLGQTQE